MPDELSELHEQAEKGRESRSLAPISVTMAILAVCVAVVSLLGHRAHTEELLFQARASDQWSYYQAKNIRRHSYEMAEDLLSLVQFKDQAQAEKVRQSYHQQAAEYTKEQSDIEQEATGLEKESALAQRKANRFDLGEVFLEVALVIASISLLTGKRLFWLLGIASGLVGLASAATGFLLH